MTWTPEEQREHRRLWVEALRSGRFTQGRGALHWVDDPVSSTGDSYCCLGVACKVAAENGLDLRRRVEPPHNNTSKRYESYGGQGGSLPVSVAAWLGISPAGHYQKNARSLTDDNDLRLHGFEEIADTIEREWGT
jgi:hypothetical protein